MRIINEYGQVVNSTLDVLEALYVNPELDLSALHIEDENEIKKYNDAKNALYSDVGSISYNKQDMVLSAFDAEAQSHWFTPEYFSTLDLVEYLGSQCKTKDEGERVALELNMFEERNMIPVLKYMIYLVDTMRENGIVWGVGRGSSVASFCLYLIGINKINPLEYNLDINEFLR